MTLARNLSSSKTDFGQEDDVGRIGGVAALGQDGAGGDPAGGAAHDLDDAAGAVVGGHAGDVDADFHDGGGVVLDDGAVAGAVVGVRQIVVDGLGHADDAQVVAALDGLLVDLVRGVLRIVAADVEEIADVVGLEHLEQPVHVLRGLLGLLLEIDLVAAGAQRGRRGVAQAFDGAGLLVVDVDQVLVQDAQDAVGAAVDLLDALVTAGFLDDARPGWR